MCVLVCWQPLPFYFLIVIHTTRISGIQDSTWYTTWNTTPPCCLLREDATCVEIVTLSWMRRALLLKYVAGFRNTGLSHLFSAWLSQDLWPSYTFADCTQNANVPTSLRADTAHRMLTFQLHSGRMLLTESLVCLLLDADPVTVIQRSGRRRTYNHPLLFYRCWPRLNGSKLKLRSSSKSALWSFTTKWVKLATSRRHTSAGKLIPRNPPQNVRNKANNRTIEKVKNKATNNQPGRPHK